MRRKNGFVLIETLVVVLLLTVTLMTLYSTFSNIMLKTKSRSNNDTIDTIYKTYYTKELLDNAYTNSQSLVGFENSFLYYSYKKADNKRVTKGECSSFSYTNEPTTNNAITADSNVLIACDYTKFHEAPTEAQKEDPLYDVINTYKISKIFYVDFSQLNSNAINDNARKKIYSNSIFDASTIEYFKGQNKSLDGTFMVIKYWKPFTADYSGNFVDSLNFSITKEYYYSKIALTKVSVNIAAKPVVLYDNGDPSATREEMIYAETPDGSEFFLPSEHTFTSNAGNVVIGWVTKYELENEEEFNRCLAGTSALKGENDHCYKAKDVIRIDDTNRALYAVWCGDGTLGGAIECQMKTSDGVNGIVKDENNEYSYYGKPDNNYVAVGKYCFNLMSTYDTGNGMKAIFYGTYDSNTHSCSPEKKVYASGVFGDSTSSLYGYAYMYKNRYDLYNIGDKDTFLSSLNLQKANTGTTVTDTYSSDESVRNRAILPYNEDIYVGNNVKYENGMYTLLDSSGNTVTETTSFFSNPNTHFETIKKNFTEKYYCLGGKTNTCSKVYYMKKNGCTDNGNLTFYVYENGSSFGNVGGAQLAFSNSFTYSGGKYKLNTSDMFYISVDDYLASSKNWNNVTILNKHRYFCKGFLKRADGDDYYCDSVGEMLGFNNSYLYGSYILYSNGFVDEKDVMNYVEGNMTVGSDERTKSSNAKSTVDDFFKNNYANETYSDFFDYDVTFCNDLTIRNDGYGKSYYDNDNLKQRVSIGDEWTVRYYYISNAPRSLYENCNPSYTYGVNSGNKLLTYPVGIISYIDLVRTGLLTPGVINSCTSNCDENVSFPISSGTKKLPSASQHYLIGAGMTMSPFALRTSISASGKPETFGYAITTTQFYWWSGSRTYTQSITPVVSFKLSNKIGDGSGTISNPFVFVKGGE